MSVTRETQVKPTPQSSATTITQHREKRRPVLMRTSGDVREPMLLQMEKEGPAPSNLTVPVKQSFHIPRNSTK